MTNFIPIFPLGIVVFPGETVNLHIFEERYKQMITECFAENKPFGIPIVINNEVMEYGTTVKITEIFEIHVDGKMDIRTEGQQIFRSLEVIKQVPEKLFSGAIVNYPDNEIAIKPWAMQPIFSSIQELHKLLKITKSFKKPDHEITSYDVAHHAGLTLEEEFEFLQLPRELQRIEYLKRHLAKVMPIVQGMESLKEKVKLNGHFRDLKSFDF